MSRELPILYQDDDVVAVNKPAGLYVHRGARTRRATRTALQMVRDQLARWVYPVHRLDRPTSGVLLFALNPDTAKRLAACFANRQIRKSYLAVVRGYIAPSALIDHPLAPDAHTSKGAQNLKPAQTAYDRLGTVELPFSVGRYSTSRYSLACVHPPTGRMHQIRRHFHHISHPVIGDTVYGDGRHNRFFREHFACRRLLLAATELAFTHPRTGVPLRVVAPVDESFGHVLRCLEWQALVPESWRV